MLSSRLNRSMSGPLSFIIGYFQRLSSMTRMGKRNFEEEGATPDLNWVPIKETVVRGTNPVNRNSPDFKRRLDKWRRKRRLRVLALVSSYCALFLIVFASSLMFFAGMGMTQEQHDRFRSFVADKFSNLKHINQPLLPKMFNGKEDIHILMVGLDKEPPHRSDSVLVAHMDLKTYETRMLSIPRDLRVDMLSSKGNETQDKLAHAFVYGGIDNVKYAVESLLGITVDHYVVIKIDGMIALIDALGGVEIDVEKDMKYHDHAQDLKIDLKQGLQVLSGEDAVGYSRFRHDAEGDIGRMRRQQTLIKAILVEIRKPGNLMKMDDIVRLFYSAVDTDLDLVQLLALKQVAKEFTADKIQSMTLNSEATNWDGISYQTETEEDLSLAQSFLMNLLPLPPDTGFDLPENGEPLPEGTPEDRNDNNLVVDPEASSGF
jgi:LCP family protein required for cell wall assembly